MADSKDLVLNFRTKGAAATAGEVAKVQEAFKKLSTDAIATNNATINLAKTLGGSFGEAQKFAASLGLSAEEADQAARRFVELKAAGATAAQAFQVVNREVGITKTQFASLNAALKNPFGNVNLDGVTDDFVSIRAETERTTKAIAAQEKAVRELERAQDQAADGAAVLAGAISVSAGIFLKSAIDARVEYEGLIAALNSATGGQGAEAFEFINQEVDRLKLNLPAATAAFTQLNSAARGTVLEGEGVREIFSAIGQAGRVNNLSLQQQEKAYLAITQVISKGVVQQEELRGQLSEALPGAVQIFARALNVSTSELGKLIETGQVGLPELLKFAQQLESETLGGVDNAVQTLGASFDQLATETNRFQVAVGESLSPAAAALANTASAVLQSFNGLSPVFQQAILLTGGLTAATLLLIAARIADNKLQVVATTQSTLKAIALQAETVKTSALAAVQAVLAARTGAATAAQQAQVAALTAGAAKAGLFAAALGAIALNVAIFNAVDSGAAESRDRINEATEALNRFREAVAAADQGSGQAFQASANAVEANRKAVEESIPLVLRSLDTLYDAIERIPAFRLFDAINPGEFSNITETAFSRVEASFANLTDKIENEAIPAFAELKNQPGGLSAATQEELSTAEEAIASYISALEQETPTTDANLAAKQRYLETLKGIQSELSGTSTATQKETTDLKEQLAVLREINEQDFKDQEITIDRQIEDQGIERDRALAEQTAAIERQNAEEIAALEKANAAEIAAQEKADAEAIAAIEQQNQQELAALQAQAAENEALIEQQFQEDLQRREEAFNRSQQLAAEQFQDKLQADQEAFNQRQNAEREAFEEGQSGQQTAVDRQLQLEFATDDDERARLEAAFAREDAIAKRRAELEAPLRQAQAEFEAKQLEDRAAFEADQRSQEAIFKKSQQLEETTFQQSLLQVKIAQETALKEVRIANEEAIAAVRVAQEQALLPVREAQEAAILEIKEAQEETLKGVREGNERALTQLKLDAAREELRIKREYEDEARERELNFKKSQRELDLENAEDIADLLASAQGATPIAGARVGGRRMGGPIEAGKPYWVGEGPGGKILPTSELIIPKQSGVVVNSFTVQKLAREVIRDRYRVDSVPSPAIAVTVANDNKKVVQAIESLHAAMKDFKRAEQQFFINQKSGPVDMNLIYQLAKAAI